MRRSQNDGRGGLNCYVFDIHGPGIDEPVAYTNNGQLYYYHADGLGSVRLVTDNSGNVVRQYGYDAYGNITGSLTDRPYAYTGREYDKETGLYYYQARYYDPKAGRFISKDPIGFAGGDVNLYGYVQNNPVNRIDPLGLRPLTDSEKSYLSPYIPQRDLNNADVHVGEMPWYAPSWAAGITRGNDIYISDPNQTFNTPGDMGLLGHELVHVGQYADGMTWLSYLWSTRNGYNNSSFEIDAYKMGAKIEFELKQKYGERLPCSTK